MNKNARFNPYIVGPTVNDSHTFVGRDDAFVQVKQELCRTDRRMIALHGQRRVGKTSFLKRLPKVLGENYCSVFFDCQVARGQKLWQTLQDLAKAIAKAANFTNYRDKLGDPERDGVGTFSEMFLPGVVESLAQKKRTLVLLFDELDILDETPDPQAKTSTLDLLHYINKLADEEARIAFIFVIGRRPNDISNYLYPILKSCSLINISMLDRDSARRLVETAMTQGTLSFAEEAIECILKLTNGHPFFTQYLCQKIWDQLRLNHVKSNVPTAGIDAVNMAAEAIINDGHHSIDWIWKGLTPASRFIWAVIAASTGGNSQNGTGISNQRLLEALRTNGVRVIISDIQRIPEQLVQEDLLERTADGSYTFRVELMRRWVMQHKPLLIVKNELDHLHPQAEVLFQAGRGYLQSSEFDKAINQLYDALRRNPNHLNARLLLGQALHEKGSSLKAIQELEEAYRYSPEDTRIRLVEVLLTYGETLGREGQVGEALRHYDRVLELSPDEVVAKERREAIWAQRAAEAQASDTYDEAARCYEQAGQTSKANEMWLAFKVSEAEKLAEKARAFEVREDWDDAISTYEQLTTGYPEIDTVKYEEALERCRTERHMKQNYAEAAIEFNNQNWDLAIRLLRDVVSRNPCYKDAAQLLANAVGIQRTGRAATLQAGAELPGAGKLPGRAPSRQSGRTREMSHVDMLNPPSSGHANAHAPLSLSDADLDFNRGADGPSSGGGNPLGDDARRGPARLDTRSQESRQPTEHPRPAAKSTDSNSQTIKMSTVRLRKSVSQLILWGVAGSLLSAFIAVGMVQLIQGRQRPAAKAVAPPPDTIKALAHLEPVATTLTMELTEVRALEDLRDHREWHQVIQRADALLMAGQLIPTSAARVSELKNQAQQESKAYKLLELIKHQYELEHYSEAVQRYYEFVPKSVYFEDARRIYDLINIENNKSLDTAVLYLQRNNCTQFFALIKTVSEIDPKNARVGKLKKQSCPKRGRPEPESQKVAGVANQAPPDLTGSAPATGDAISPGRTSSTRVVPGAGDLRPWPDTRESPGMRESDQSPLDDLRSQLNTGQLAMAKSGAIALAKQTKDDETRKRAWVLATKASCKQGDVESVNRLFDNVKEEHSQADVKFVCSGYSILFDEKMRRFYRAQKVNMDGSP